MPESADTSRVELPLPVVRPRTLSRVVAWRLALGALVTASVALRTAGAWSRATPNYFPDEYLYAALSRGLGSVRGEWGSFPSLLQPLLTAPFWHVGSLETSYRLVQLVDCVAMSLAALPVWWLARRLGVPRGAAFAAAAVSLAIPDLGYGGWILASPVAYPLFVSAVALGTAVLARPSARGELAFLAVAGLAAFAQIQLAALVPAYAVAALLVGRRRLGDHRILLGFAAVAVLGAAVGGLGYYRKAPSAFHLTDPAAVAALGRNAFVLALAAGWILVPAALLGLAAALTRPRSTEERAFGALALTAGGAMLLEAALYGDLDVVHERYSFYAIPLLAIAFALHASRGWPWRRAHALIAAILFTVAAAVPLSGWAAAGKSSHSLFLLGVLRVDGLAGSAGAGALIVAATASALAVVAAVAALRPRVATPLVAVLAVAAGAASSLAASSFDARNAHAVHDRFLPDGAQWVDREHVGRVTLVAGPLVPRTSVHEQLFWNRTVTRGALLPGAVAPDPYTWRRFDRVRGAVLLDQDGQALVPREPVRTSGLWTLARSPALDLRLDGRYGDGWLAPAGRIVVWRSGVVAFTATAPERMTLRVDGRTIPLRAHVPVRIALRACGAATARYAFSSSGFVGLRAVSARASFPTFRPGAPCTASGFRRVRSSE